MSTQIKDQVRLPFSVALAVVMQGIRIRFGRSLVTVMGVVLGIAFLMSILTGQVIRNGVEDEENLRQEIRRMYSFLIDEMGPPRDMTVALIVQRPATESEFRLLKQLERDGLATIRVLDLSVAPAVNNLQTGLSLNYEASSAKDLVTADTKALLVFGNETIAKADWDTMLTNAQDHLVLASTVTGALSQAPDSAISILLERKMTEEEIIARDEREEQAAFRSMWIVIISLLVTVIGIANAMLMSVTERFREIGTMKCLGALSGFVRLLFLIEASIMGVIGSLAGALLGFLFTLVMYSFIYGFGNAGGALDLGKIFLYLLFSLVAGVILSIIAAIYPANVASSMVPADALRTNI